MTGRSSASNNDCRSPVRYTPSAKSTAWTAARRKALALATGLLPVALTTGVIRLPHLRERGKTSSPPAPTASSASPTRGTQRCCLVGTCACATTAPASCNLPATSAQSAEHPCNPCFSSRSLQPPIQQDQGLQQQREYGHPPASARCLKWLQAWPQTAAASAALGRRLRPAWVAVACGPTDIFPATDRIAGPWRPGGSCNLPVNRRHGDDRNGGVPLPVGAAATTP